MTNGLQQRVSLVWGGVSPSLPNPLPVPSGLSHGGPYGTLSPQSNLSEKGPYG